MAKQSIKPAKKTVKKPAKSSSPSIVKITENILDKLKAANLEHQLQSDITWCLGSYAHDNNPIGLYEVASKSLEIFKAEHAKKTKGFTAKLISDIEKALQAR